jgi:hypothetical protein
VELQEIIPNSELPEGWYTQGHVASWTYVKDGHAAVAKNIDGTWRFVIINYYKQGFSSPYGPANEKAKFPTPQAAMLAVNILLSSKHSNRSTI